jgi:HK97 gp10 family phage protein
MGYKVTNVADDPFTPGLLVAMGVYMGATANRARRLVPTRTFRLQRSISSGAALVGGRVVGRVGAREKYARHVEKGTSKQQAQPFIGPAVLQTPAGNFRA